MDQMFKVLFKPQCFPFCLAERNCFGKFGRGSYKENLSVTSHIHCIVVRCLINVVYLRHVPLSGHEDVAFFERRR